MMDPSDALGMQNDIHVAAELYLDRPPAFPPEDCAFANCHERLSIEDVNTGALVLASYLGMGSEADGFSDIKAIIRAYYLDREKRAKLVAALGSK